MKKTRIISIILVLVLLVSSVVTGYATEATYSEEQILNMLTMGKSVKFDQMTDEEIQMFASTGTNAVVQKEQGLKLTVGNAKKSDGVTDLGYGEINLDLTHNLKEGEAVKFTFMPTTKQRDVLVIADFMGNGERLKVRTEVLGNKQVLVYHTGENGSSSARGISSFEVIPNKTYDVIAKKNAGNIDLYAREATASAYQLILSQQMVYQSTASVFRLHITGPSGSTAIFKEVTQYVKDSKSGILGASGGVLHHFDFDESYDGVVNTDGTSSMGLDFGKISRWDFNGKYIPDGGAMAVRFQTSNSSFEAWVAGEKGRAILRVGADGKVLIKTKTNPRNEIEIATIEQNTWYTFLVKDNGSGWDAWMASGEENKFSKLISTTEKEETTTSTSTNVTLSGTSGSYVDYFTIFGTTAGDIPDEDNMILLHKADFTENTDFLNQSRVILKENAEIADGKLCLRETAVAETTVGGEYFFKEAGIPAGGFAEYSVEGSRIIHKFFQGGQYMAVNTVAYGIDGLTPTLKYPDTIGTWSSAENMTHTPNVKWIYRISRSTDGTKYNVWRRTEDVDNWSKVFHNITARSDDTNLQYGFEGVGEVGYVKIYTPGERGVVLTDGENTTNIISIGTELCYRSEVEVHAKAPEDAVLFVGKYDVKGILEDACQEQLVKNQDKAVKIDTTDTTTLKVVVWDSAQTMRPIYPAYTLNCNQTHYFIDFNDGDDISDWTIGDGFSMSDGKMNFVGTSDESGIMRKTIDPVDEYVFEMSVQCPEYGYNGLYLSLVTGNYYVTALVNPERNTDVRTSTALAQGGEMVWDKDEWKLVRVETYDGGKRGILSFDGVPYMDFELPESSYNYNEILIGGYQRIGGTKATEFSIDWMSFEPKRKQEEISLMMPSDGGTYSEGEDIELKAKVDSSLNIPQVEYKIHGNTVAVGVAPDYQATLSGVTSGDYEIIAEYQNYQSDAYSFAVASTFEVELKIEGTTITPDFGDESERVAKVEYYLDGKLINTVTESPFDVEITNITIANHKISAKFYDGNGVLIGTDDTIYTPDVTEENMSISYANDITYQVSGDSGTAEVQVNNGRHSLVIKHSPDKVSYLTRDGMKEYDVSCIGNWEILTDAYVADVYRNGQLVFSYLMPKTEEVGSSASQNGLTVSGFTVVIPEHKTNYFLQTDYAEEGMKTYAISDLPYDYNLDFIAKKSDNFRFAVSDGDFHLDFEFEDGKIWAQDVNNEGMHPSRRYQTDVPDVEGDIYYRAEVAGGFMRLYADGKWLTTVRMPRSSDPDGLAIETEDVLKYISLCDNEDLYLYSDTFDGSGEISSLDYWKLKNTEGTIDEPNGRLTLQAMDGNEGRAEINATPGYAVVDSTLNLSDCTGGAYILFNSASNVTEMRAGYNKSTRQFEMIKTTRDGVKKITADAGYDMILGITFGKSISMRVELQQYRGREIASLYVDGKLVLQDTESIKERGTVGIVFDGGKLQVEEFHYRGDGHPVVSATEWNTDLSTQYNLIEKEDEWVLLDWNSKLRSTDFGKTWTNETFANTMESCHTVRLQSGALLVANRVWGKDEHGFRTTTYRCGISYDDGETWNTLGTIATPAYGEATCNRLKQGPSGRVYFVMSRRGAHDDGWCRVYWSDDEGKTWKESLEIGFSNVGHVFEEAEAIEMPDGEVRLYFRNETGMLLYVTSDDRGETWNLTPKKTSLLMPSTFFNIEQDPYEPNTFYAVYTYDNSNEHGRDQGPRCRLAVSVSYDGGNEWNFLGTLFEEQLELYYATRGNDVNTMMNININATKNHLVVTLPYNSEAEIPDRHYLLRIITLDKTKIKSLVKPEKLHTRVATIEQSTPVIEKKMNRTIVLSNENAKALVGGVLYDDIRCDDALQVDVVAEFLGAFVESKSTNEVVFKLGEGTIQFEGEDIRVSDERIFISMDAVAEKFHLNIIDAEEIRIISPYPEWSVEQIRTFRYAMNLFADSQREYVNTNLNPKDTWEEYVKYVTNL